MTVLPDTRESGPGNSSAYRVTILLKVIRAGVGKISDNVRFEQACESVRNSG